MMSRTSLPPSTTAPLPSRPECFQILKKFHTPARIVAHARQVNRVAVWLTQELIKNHYNVNLDLVDRASLLHDTVRITERAFSVDKIFQNATPAQTRAWSEQRKRWPITMSHVQVNYEIFKNRYPQMARVIWRHGIEDAENLLSWEEKIVNYADRRVRHDQIVTLRERLTDLEQRYSRVPGVKNLWTPGRKLRIYEVYERLENEIFGAVKLQPSKLKDYVQAATTKSLSNQMSKTAKKPCLISKSVGAVVVNGKKYVLLIFQAKNKYWEFPKGKMEKGEREYDTLRRELREETGIQKLHLVPNFRHVIKYDYHYKGQRVCRQVVFYLIISNERVRISKEHREFMWMPLGRAAGRLKHANQRRVLDAVQQKLSS